jgi:hypothetical protein
MLVIGRAARVAVVMGAVVAFAGCSSSDDAPDPAPDGPLIDATTMRGALLQPADIGPTWATPAQTPSTDALVSFCGGDTAAPPTPPGPSVVASTVVDEGTKGAQTLNQIALVHQDVSAATASRAMLRAVADGCAPTVTMPEKSTDERQEPAYSETVSTSPLDDQGWSGFVVVRHKQYDPKHPATADTAVAVLQKRNVVLVDAYAIYQLSTASAAPNFTTDWQKLVGTVVNRVPA